MRNPRSSYFALISGRARDALISLLSTLDDLSRDTLRTGNAEPAFKCVIGQVLSHRRYIRQSRQAGCGRHCQSTHLAAPDLWNRIGRGCELHVHLTADNIRQGECDTTIWHVDHLNTGHRLEEFSGQMADRADALRSQVDFSGVCFGVGDELGNRRHRKRWFHDHHEARLVEQSDRRSVAYDVVGQLVVPARGGRVRNREEEKRVAVGTRADGLGSAESGSPSRSVFHDEWLTEAFRKPLAVQSTV